MGLSRSSQTSQSDFPVFCGWSNQTLLVRIKMAQGDYHWYILNLYISAHTEFRYEIRVDDEISSSTTLSWPAMKRLRPGVYFNDDIIEIATQWVLACIFWAYFSWIFLRAYLRKSCEANPALNDQVHLWNSFFFSKIKEWDMLHGCPSNTDQWK